MDDKNKEKNNEKFKIIALVNDEKITRSELDSFANQIAVIQKITVPDNKTEEGKKFERMALDQIINNILLFQDAKNQGIGINREKVDSQYSMIAAQVGGEEKLNKVLEKAGISAENLRNDLERQNIIEKYFAFIKEKNEITATEEEIKDFYNEQIAPQNPDLDLKAVEPQIRQRIEQQKLSYPLSEIIENLRKEAEIKILL